MSEEKRRRKIRREAQHWSIGDADRANPSRATHVACRLGSFRRSHASLLRRAADHRRLGNIAAGRTIIGAARQRRQAHAA